MSSMTSRGTVVVTGASSGIGAASALALAADGWDVVAAARRIERLEQLDGVRPMVCDVTDDASVNALADAVRECDAVVHCAGGALGSEPVAEAGIDDWRWMYEVNVLGVLRVTKALLPALRQSPHGHVLLMGSTAGRVAYEGGGGYTAAKHAAAVLAETLRLELNGTPVRVSEVAPGMVATDEFATHRFRGDAGAAAKVYEGVDHPLTAEDVAQCVRWVLDRPAHVDVELLVVRPVAQSAQHKLYRGRIF